MSPDRLALLEELLWEYEASLPKESAMPALIERLRLAVSRFPKKPRERKPVT